MITQFSDSPPLGPDEAGAVRAGRAPYTSLDDIDRLVEDVATVVR